ncbi:MAG: sigma-70 family RNA polymerase sigma factor [Acidimicrobiales bacterium]
MASPTVVSPACIDRAEAPKPPPCPEPRDVALLSDGELVRGIGGGSHDSLAEAYSRHGQSVHALAERLCGPDGAADVTQDVFLLLWRSPERFDGQRGSLRTFLRVQAHGRAIDVLRSDTARHAREVADVRGQGVPAGVDELVLIRSAAGDAWCRLYGLAEAEREAIALAFVGGYTYREVAEILRLPEGTVKSRIRVGLGRLRVALSDQAGTSSPVSGCPPPPAEVPAAG